MYIKITSQQKFAYQLVDGANSHVEHDVYVVNKKSCKECWYQCIDEISLLVEVIVIFLIYYKLLAMLKVKIKRT